MVYLNKLQQETLLKVDDLVNENKTFEDITNELYKDDYVYLVETKNGYTSKTRYELHKKIEQEDGSIKYENSYVWIIKRRNGLAFWETIKLS